MNLRDYQQEGFDAIVKTWQTDDLIMFVLATGGGKTVTFVKLIQRDVLAGRRVLLIAHREELITQAWNTLYANNIFAGIIMAGYPESFHLPVQVCSIQTLVRRKLLPPADVIYFDEGHHAQPDNTYGKVIKQYQSAKFLLVTATPYRLSGEGFTFLHPYKPTKLIINRTLAQLQDAGWLVRLRYMIASMPDLTELHIQRGDYIEEESQKAMELAPLVESYTEHAAGLCGVTFAVNIAHSLQVCQQYEAAGVPVAHLDGESRDDYRQKTLADFRAGLIKVISNVGIITEGFDFPDLDFVQLARPTKSLNMYLQMVGRVTRPERGVDAFATAAERLAFIKRSRKPQGIILDNAGCWLDHGLPDAPRDWDRYFRGTKKDKKKEEDTMEMLVYVAERPDGTRIRTHKAREVEGLKLVEVTAELARKVVNVTSLKEFDRLFAVYRNMRHMKKPGYMAAREYFGYCKKNRILLVDEIWNYLFNKLVFDPRDKQDGLRRNRALNPGAYPLALYEKSSDEIMRVSVSEAWLKQERGRYETENQRDVLEARFKIKVPDSGKLAL